jgi:hypothetical protein
LKRSVNLTKLWNNKEKWRNAQITNVSNEMRLSLRTCRYQKDNKILYTVLYINLISQKWTNSSKKCKLPQFTTSDNLNTPATIKETEFTILKCPKRNLHSVSLENSTKCLRKNLHHQF